MSPRRLSLASALFTAAACVACTARKDAAPADTQRAPQATVSNPETASVAAPAAPAAPATQVAPRMCDELLLTPNGAGGIRIGDRRDSVRARCTVLMDSTEEDGEGMIQGKVVVDVKGARVVLEIGNDEVYGMTVTDTLFRTADSLGPGTPMKRLLALPGANAGGAQGGGVMVQLPDHCAMYFFGPSPPARPGLGQHWADVVAAVPADARVDRVMIGRCY